MPAPKTNVIFFYATRADYGAVFTDVEDHISLKYVLQGVFEAPIVTSFISALEIPSLGINSVGDNVRGDRFLVINEKAEITVEEVPQRRGGILYFIDGFRNPSGITFQPSGLYEQSCLISGLFGFGQSARNPDAKSLLNSFSNSIRKNFTQVRGNWLGPEALQHLKSGMRLTDDVRSPEEYDLKM